MILPRVPCSVVVAGLLFAGSSDLAAQVRTDSLARPVAAAPSPVDSLRPPISPGRAFLASLFLPGLGQSRLGRQLPGAIYVGVEAMSIVMLLKTQNELRIARQGARDAVVSGYQRDPVTGAPLRDESGAFVPLGNVASRFDAERVEARRAQVEDWIAVLVANHLFAGADAFVAALLWDLPARVGLRHGPAGYSLGLSVRW